MIPVNLSGPLNFASFRRPDSVRVTINTGRDSIVWPRSTSPKTISKSAGSSLISCAFASATRPPSVPVNLHVSRLIRVRLCAVRLAWPVELQPIATHRTLGRPVTGPADRHPVPGLQRPAPASRDQFVRVLCPAGADWADAPCHAPAAVPVHHSCVPVFRRFCQGRPPSLRPSLLWSLAGLRQTEPAPVYSTHSTRYYFVLRRWVLFICRPGCRHPAAPSAVPFPWQSPSAGTAAAVNRSLPGPPPV